MEETKTEEKDTFFKRIARGFKVLLFKMRTLATKLNEGQMQQQEQQKQEQPKKKTEKVEQVEKPVTNDFFKVDFNNIGTENLGL